jgi:GT2 family glycosyltransferase
MLGIVIVNYNTWRDTLDCIESIKETTNCGYKIYVVENNSPNDSYKNLKLNLTGSTTTVLIKNEVNNGYSGGNNVGIKKALSDGADAILISNSDIIYNEKSIDEMYKYITTNNSIGMVGPQVILPNGKTQHLIRDNFSFYNYVFSKKPFKFLTTNRFKQKTFHTNFNYKTEFIFYGLLSGCCLMVSKEYLDKCGLLDENVFLYYEEGILALKAKEKKLLTCILPQVTVLHQSSASIGNKNSAFSRYHRYYSSMYMLKKYNKINNLQLLVVSFINYIPFLINSIIKREYRNYIKRFTKECLTLFKI